MREFIHLICYGLVLFLLSGFDSGIEAEKVKNAQVKPSGPVLEYEEPIVTRESNQDLYHQYHLLVITSLEESSSTLAEDPAWSFSMAQNAYHYIKLIIKLLKEEHKDLFVSKNNDLNALLSDMRKRNIPSSKRKKLAKELNALAKDLENNFFFDRIQTWIKN